MAAHMGPQQQPMFQSQHTQQPPNANQQRQMPNAQQKTTAGAQPTQINFDPQLTLWSLEKTKSSDAWADVKPQQQHISLAELQEELEKFKRKDLTAKKVLDDLKSANCRRQINSLADDQTKALQKHNKSLKYILGGIFPETRYIDRRKKDKVLVRVQVILQTVTSGLTEPKPATGAGNAAGAQANKQGGNGQQQGQNSQQKNSQQQGQQQGQPHMGQSQQFDQRPPPIAGGLHHGGGQAPPPPPPPPGVLPMHGGHGMPGAHPPPPPHMAGHGGMHESHHSHMNGMPGAFPEPRSGQPPIQILDPHLMHSYKSKQKVHRRGHSDDSSNEWDTDTGSSNSGSFDVYSVENGYSDVRRGHHKHAKRDIHVKKTHRRVQSRSRSRGPTKEHRIPTRQRRDSDSSNPRSGRHSPRFSTSRSPYHSSGEEDRYGHSKKNKHRSRSRESLTRSYNKKAFDRLSTSPMSRTSSQQSWSDASSSNLSGKHYRRDRDSDRERGRSHGHRRTHSHSHRHHGEPNSSKYDLPKTRFNPLDGLADDYPHETARVREHDQYQEPVFAGTRPLPPRRAATQMPEQNPFFPETALPHRQARTPAYDYAAGMPERDYEYVPRPSAYMTGHSPTGNGRYTEDEVRVMLDHVNQTKRHAPLRRAHTMGPGYADTQHIPLRRQYPEQRERGGFFDDEEVNFRYASRVPAYDTTYRR